MRYRKKPVIIEAFKLSDLSSDDTMIIPGWVLPALGDGTIAPRKEGGASILTDSGRVFAEPTDWVIRDTKGELYPCKPEIFAEIYEHETAAQAIPVNDVIDHLRGMRKDEDRINYLDQITDIFCTECGAPHGATMACTCMRDD